MVNEADSVRIWGRLDELKEMLTRVLTIQEEREKLCIRHDACINRLKNKVHALEVNQGRYSVLSAMVSAILTAAVIKFFLG